MKYELETIPVWDAFKEECECPICLLFNKAEENYIKFFMGNSVMNPEMRVKVNKTGFCSEHFSQMLERRSPHYLGLMLHTHFKAYREELAKLYKNLEKSAESAATKLKTPLKDKKLLEQSAKVKGLISKKAGECLVCDKIDYTLKRYTFTTVYMWKKDPEFKEFFNKSKGFCLEHQNLLLEMAGEILGGKEMGLFCQDLITVQEENLKRLEDEVLYFTQKFSHENNDKPWNGTKDAHYRLIQKITGRITDQ